MSVCELPPRLNQSLTLKWAGAHPVLALHGECDDDDFNTMKMRRRMMQLVVMMLMIMLMMRAELNYSGVVEGHRG